MSKQAARTGWFGRKTRLALALIQAFTQGVLPGCGGEEPAPEIQAEVQGAGAAPESSRPTPEEKSVSEMEQAPPMSLTTDVNCSHYNGRCTGAFCLFGNESCAIGSKSSYCVQGCWLWAWIEECSDGTTRKGTGTCVW